MILTFFTARQGNCTHDLVTEKRKIALMYLKSWFIIDLISIIPIDYILQNSSTKLGNFAKFSAFSRFPKLTRLFRIIRMTKMFRICKDRKRIKKGVGDWLKLSANSERIIIFCAVIAFICHVLTCLWVITT